MEPITYCQVCSQLSTLPCGKSSRNGEYFAACKAGRFYFSTTAFFIP